RSAIRRAEIPERRAAGLDRLAEDGAHAAHQVVEPPARGSVLPDEAPRREFGTQMRAPQRLARIDVADAGDDALVEQHRLERRRPALQARRQSDGVEIVAERLGPEPGEARRVRLAREQFDEAEATGIVIYENEPAVLGVRQLEHQVVVPFVLAGLV